MPIIKAERCPECDSRNIFISTRHNEKDNYTSQAKCRDCGYSGPKINKFDWNDVINAWNEMVRTIITKRNENTTP